MPRKSARMLKPGMVIVINAKRRTVKSVIRDDVAGRVIIRCTDGNEFRRTLGAKIDLIAYG